MTDFNWQGYRTLAWGGLALLAISAGVALFQGRIGGAITLACFLAAGVAFLLYADELPALFDTLFVAAGLLNAAGFVWDLFHQPGPYDEIAHVFTIFAITLALGFVVYGYRLITFHGQHMLIVLTIASFGVAVGALWEVAEWLADMVLATQVVVGLDDTVTDLIMDSMGSLAAALLSLAVIHKEAEKHQAHQQTA